MHNTQNIPRTMMEVRAKVDPMYIARLESVGVWDGDFFKISLTDLYAVNHNKNTDVPTKDDEPSALDLAKNFTAALFKWIKAGVPTVSRELYEARLAVCSSCEFWDSAARLGLGKCTHTKCGCTKTKHWLATEKCPIDKWPSASAQEYQQ